MLLFHGSSLFDFSWLLIDRISDYFWQFYSISGRATHVAKLRAEFDSGADFDMRECGPGELDPHAVSSIFKAYLRERECLTFDVYC